MERLQLDEIGHHATRQMLKVTDKASPEAPKDPNDGAQGGVPGVLGVLRACAVSCLSAVTAVYHLCGRRRKRRGWPGV